MLDILLCCLKHYIELESERKKDIALVKGCSENNRAHSSSGLVHKSIIFYEKLVPKV